MNNKKLKSLRIKNFLLIVGNENYNFDVIPNITIKCLKKIICSAADLNKTRMKIFRKLEDFTDQNEKLLNEIRSYHRI
jgi:hypothetical protein